MHFLAILWYFVFISFHVFLSRCVYVGQSWNGNGFRFPSESESESKQQQNKKFKGAWVTRHGSDECLEFVNRLWPTFSALGAEKKRRTKQQLRTTKRINANKQYNDIIYTLVDLFAIANWLACGNSVLFVCVCKLHHSTFFTSDGWKQFNACGKWKLNKYHFHSYQFVYILWFLAFMLACMQRDVFLLLLLWANATHTTNYTN